MNSNNDSYSKITDYKAYNFLIMVKLFDYIDFNVNNFKSNHWKCRDFLFLFPYFFQFRSKERREICTIKNLMKRWRWMENSVKLSCWFIHIFTLNVVLCRFRIPFTQANQNAKWNGNCKDFVQKKTHGENLFGTIAFSIADNDAHNGFILFTSFLHFISTIIIINNLFHLLAVSRVHST